MSPPALEVLKEMRRVVAPVPSEQAERARRERVIARMLELQRELGAGRRRRVSLLLLAAALTGVLAVVALVITNPFGQLAEGGELTARVLSGQLRLTEGGAGHPALTRLDLAAAPFVRASEGTSVDVQLPSAAALEIAPASELALQRRQQSGAWSERVELREGQVRLRVPKLGAGASLAVHTRDALVEVRGTRFSVAVVKGEAGAFTRVEVEEGRVAVTSARGQELIAAGQAWESREVPTARFELPAVPAPEPEPAATPRAPPPKSPAKPPSASETPSELEAQNRLVQGAALAKRRGLPRLALRRLETLMQTYPDSENAHNARVDHFRLLAATGELERARASARAYLERYPGGFARGEAERLINAGSQPE